jgi:uncharacterized membrane protein
VSTGRLESFSDGVIAVAATLLVLNIHEPVLKGNETLVHGLLNQWHVYAAYAISFITIGIIWINHHVMISRLRVADHAILMLNLVLLMLIAVLPFATSLMTGYLRGSHGQAVVAAVYSGTFLLMALAFSALNRLILFGRAHMLNVELSHERRRQILLRAVSGVIPYAIATALAPVSPYATLIICGAVAAFYALPIASGAETTAV